MKSSDHFRSPKPPKIRPADLSCIYKILRRRFGHQHWWPGDTPLEIMVGAILTQNTAWHNVEKAIANLKKSKRLSFRSLRRTSRKVLARLIRPAGYYNVKAERLKEFIGFLDSTCRGDLKKLCKDDPASLRTKLLGVKGIGPETADSILLYALGKRSFVIDAYTRRIFSRHRLACHDLDYGSWKRVFERALPRSRGLYKDFHAQIVRLAKEFCRTQPQCGLCPLCDPGPFKKKQSSF